MSNKKVMFGEEFQALESIEYSVIMRVNPERKDEEGFKKYLHTTVGKAESVKGKKLRYFVIELDAERQVSKTTGRKALIGSMDNDTITVFEQFDTPLYKAIAKTLKSGDYDEDTDILNFVVFGAIYKKKTPFKYKFKSKNGSGIGNSVKIVALFNQNQGDTPQIMLERAIEAIPASDRIYDKETQGAQEKRAAEQSNAQKEFESTINNGGEEGDSNADADEEDDDI